MREDQIAHPFCHKSQPRTGALQAIAREGLEDTVQLLCAAPLSTVDYVAHFGRVPVDRLGTLAMQPQRGKRSALRQAPTRTFA